ncbi:MAG: tetratricopeptide repeat protein [Chloroflexi bacterium]|nr:tetratricopeptide repeat protein [Chloroflexota bacterium]
MGDIKFSVGELIENRYRVLSVIDTGGMGILYRVSDEAYQNREVHRNGKAHRNGAKDSEIIALKTVRLDAPAAETTENVERFQREFQLLTQLRHPNLVSVYNFGITTEGELYFTMEWIEGQDLEPGRRSLEPEATVSVIVQICRALAYLHARGVIHGDLKPANVLVAADGQVKIVDFGVALEVRSVEILSRYYTPGYSAPEVREKSFVDHRADLYGLGAMWYALLVGEAPTFMFGSERLIRLTIEETIEAYGQISQEVGKIIVRLLATSPEERYASANEVIEAINQATNSSYALETRETASSYALRGRFVGREAEMKDLREVWEQVRSGSGRMALVSGEGGVGKTRLVEEFVVQAELSGAWIARGQCVESGSSAYRPWREILRVLMRYVEGADQATARQVGPVLATLLPELLERDYMTDLAPPPDLEPQAAQLRLNSMIAQVLRAAAELRPTVVVIEDGHWADEATLNLLSFVPHALEEKSLLVCVTYRDDGSNPVCFLDKFANGHIERIPLTVLSSEITTDLVCSMLGLEQLPHSLMQRVQQTTKGNAFFVRELVRSLAEDGSVLRRTVTGWEVELEALRKVQMPESIRQVAGQRLDHLSEEARHVLQRAAIIGPLFWDGAVEEISQVSGEQVRAALREGLERELIFERLTSSFLGEREFLFAKPAVQEVGYENVSPEERQKDHARVAAWLTGRGDEQANEHLGLIADHLERAGQRDRAIVYLQRAGEQAASQFANVEAINYLNRALDLLSKDERAERYGLLLAREKVYDVQGAREAQSQDLETLEELAKALDDNQRRTEVALRQASYSEATGDYAQAIASAKSAVKFAQLTQDIDHQAEGQWRWGYALWRKGEYQAARPQLEQALALARETGARRVEADSLNDLGVISSIQGEPAEAKIYMEQALDIRRETGDRQGESLTLNNLGIIASQLGNKDEVFGFTRQALHICREIGDRRAEGLVLGNLGEYAIKSGDYTMARMWQEQALHICCEIGDRLGECGVRGGIGVVYRSLGQYAKAKDYFEQVLRISDEIEELRMKSENLGEMGLLFHHLGDDKAAWQYCHQAQLIAQKAGIRESLAFALMGLGHASMGLGQLEEAAESYQQALTLWRELNQHKMTLDPLAGLARVSLAQDDLLQAQACVEEIISHLETNDPLQGMSEPFLVYLTCYQVLNTNQDSRARDILTSAHRLLQERAAKITDDDMRRSFLENVAAHREIVREWTNRQNNE